MQPTATVPLFDEAFDAIITLIPTMLKDDEAGPAFFIMDEEWAKEHNYEEESQ
jgi:hypothetical protein